MMHAGDVPILVVTERWLFFKRCQIKQAQHILYFTPVDNPSIYRLLASGSRNSLALTVTYFTKFHSPHLERILGRVEASNLIRGGEESAPASRVFCFSNE
eukprot:GHVO01036558.1.p1 GENE.GHVO01036558.1~~GHVO01036558.1.p1  ORF type:complete len:100 (-),score=9.37 GHVO01036558.1:35-334(-)